MGPESSFKSTKGTRILLVGLSPPAGRNFGGLKRRNVLLRPLRGILLDILADSELARRCFSSSGGCFYFVRPRAPALAPGPEVKAATKAILLYFHVLLFLCLVSFCRPDESGARGHKISDCA